MLHWHRCHRSIDVIKLEKMDETHLKVLVQDFEQFDSHLLVWWWWLLSGVLVVAVMEEATVCLFESALDEESVTLTQNRVDALPWPLPVARHGNGRQREDF